MATSRRLPQIIKRVLPVVFFLAGPDRGPAGGCHPRTAAAAGLRVLDMFGE
jgi:hypothetical protein